MPTKPKQTPDDKLAELKKRRAELIEQQSREKARTLANVVRPVLEAHDRERAEIDAQIAAIVRNRNEALRFNPRRGELDELRMHLAGVRRAHDEAKEKVFDAQLWVDLDAERIADDGWARSKKAQAEAKMPKLRAVLLSWAKQLDAGEQELRELENEIVREWTQ